jgi:hypothetical protein
MENSLVRRDRLRYSIGFPQNIFIEEENALGISHAQQKMSVRPRQLGPSQPKYWMIPP